MDGLLWPLILITIGIGLLALELFVPSAGALGVFAGIAFLAAVVVGFTEDFYIGTSMMVAVAVIVPVFFGIFAHLYPRTPIGKQMLLARPDETLAGDDEEELLRTLIGKRGRAKTKMLPSGAVVIDGQTYDAATEGLPLEAGQPVEVIAAQFKRLVVRPVENDATPPPLVAEEVDRPFESPFEDPLL